MSEELDGVLSAWMGDAIGRADAEGGALEEIDLLRRRLGSDEVGDGAEPESVVEVAVGVEGAQEQCLEAIVGYAAELDVTEGVLQGGEGGVAGEEAKADESVGHVTVLDPMGEVADDAEQVAGPSPVGEGVSVALGHEDREAG